MTRLNVLWMKRKKRNSPFFYWGERMSLMSVPHEQEQETRQPKCPVCGKPATQIADSIPVGTYHWHCGKVVCLIAVSDHYVSFKELPDPLPSKGCPVCGEPMRPAGVFKWISGKEEGLERMCCNKDDHYVMVTKDWCQINKR